uniref:Uncharacterized protein n=1 Tax=Leptobrachium leishanense TaxID=445787 RepID=A0A8C5MFJ6_9ANUR
MAGVARDPESSPLPPCCLYASPCPSDDSESEEEAADADLDPLRQTARRTQGPPGQHKGYVGVARSVYCPAGMTHRTTVPCCHMGTDYGTPATKTISSAPCPRSSRAVPRSRSKSRAVPRSRSRAVPQSRSRAVPRSKSRAVPRSKSRAVPRSKSRAVPRSRSKSRAVPRSRSKSRAVPRSRSKSRAVPRSRSKSRAVPRSRSKSRAVRGPGPRAVLCYRGDPHLHYPLLPVSRSSRAKEGLGVFQG